MKRVCSLIIIIMMLSCGIVSAGECFREDGCLLDIRHNGGENYFHKRARPGEDVSIDFHIINNSGRTLTNRLLVYDSLTAVNGGNSVLKPGEAVRRETAAWFDFDSETVTLEPGGATYRELDMSVPDDVKPGLYTAILALYSKGEVENASAGSKAGEVSLSIKSGYSTTLAVVIEVPGEMHGSVKPVEGAYIRMVEKTGKSFLMVPLENDGDTYEFPEITATIRDGRGERLTEKSLDMDIFYRKTSSFAAVDITGILKKGGKYTVEADVEFGRGDKKHINSAEYEIGADNRTARKTEKARIINSEKPEAKGGEGAYLILKRQTIVWAGVSLAGVVLVFAITRFVGKGRG